MRYTKTDYSNAIAVLTGNGRTRARLTPSELRALDQVRIAYVMHADVPLADVKLARAIFEATRTTPAMPPAPQRGAVDLNAALLTAAVMLYGAAIALMLTGAFQ